MGRWGLRAHGPTVGGVDRVHIRTEDGCASVVLRRFGDPLLDGYRGAPAADVGALEDVLGRVSALVADHPAIAELDCNPVIVGPAGAAIVDMRVRVADAEGPARALPGTLPAPA